MVKIGPSVALLIGGAATASGLADNLALSAGLERPIGGWDQSVGIVPREIADLKSLTEAPFKPRAVTGVATGEV